MAQKLRTGLGPKVENGAQPKNIKDVSEKVITIIIMLRQKIKNIYKNVLKV